MNAFGQPHYGITRLLADASFEEAIERVTARLADNGFGILTSIDVQNTLKQKIGAEISRYTVLGACNPSLAHQALSADPAFGLLMPCSVVIAEQEDGRIAVSVAEPGAMFRALQRDDLDDFAAQVRAPLEAAMQSL
ncbi:MAG: hypothetical protein CMP23_05850 [Rickettsiales bacterium]|nr:hypothetical protein [Rickettsiales bacterium]|tara:strand:+ start:468 stop:875 length:408 start_codon:yes stop_codon:yes gene_type:complete